MEDYRDAVMRIVDRRYPTPPNVMDFFEAYHDVPPLRRHRLPPHDLCAEIHIFLEETKGHTLEDLHRFIDQFF